VSVYVVNGMTTSCPANKVHCALPRLGPQSSWSNSNRRTPKQGLSSWAAFSLTITRPPSELRATLLRFPAPPIPVTSPSRSALPLRLLAAGSALSWEQAVLRQLEGCNVLSHWGGRAAASKKAAGCTHNMAHERTTRHGLFHCSSLAHAPPHSTQSRGI